MLPNIEEKISEVEGIFRVKHAEGIKDSDIFRNYLTAYFQPKIPSSDWMFFVNLARKWTKTEIEAKKAEELKKEEQGITENEAIDMQQNNRRRTIVLLKRLLDKYEKNRNFYKKITVREISTLYKIIQSAEDAMEKTELAKSKLKLDVAKTFFLPYQKYSPEELKKLKNNLDESFQRIGQSGGVGQIGSGTGS